MGAKYFASPFGEVLHPWINKPDTKFGPATFKADLALDGEEAAKFKQIVDAAVDEAFTELTKNKTAKEVKNFTKQYPYKAEEDDDGNETGRTIFRFRQNAVIKVKDGSEKQVIIGIRDANDEETKVQIGHGSVIRVKYSARGYLSAKDKVISVRLDFAQVQIKTLKAISSGGGFGKVEGGFVDAGDGPEAHDEAPAEDNNGSDY